MLDKAAIICMVSYMSFNSFSKKFMFFLLPFFSFGLLLTATSSVSFAHGSFTTNLSEQSYVFAPKTAEFVFTTPVDLSSASAQLRSLGSVDVSPEVYFNTDVPTTELTLAGPSSGFDTKLVFELPDLPKGLYALDWEVTPENDHSTESTQLFKVTEGVSDSPVSQGLVLGVFGGLAVLVAVVFGFIFASNRKKTV